MATRGIALRDWTLSRSDYETKDEFRAAVVNELAAFEHIGERLGIGLASAPIRERVGDSWITRGWYFETATVPAAQRLEDGVAEKLEKLREAERVTVPDDSEAALVEDTAPGYDPSLESY